MLQTTSQPPPAYPFILRILNLILQTQMTLKPLVCPEKYHSSVLVGCAVFRLLMVRSQTFLDFFLFIMIFF